MPLLSCPLGHDHEGHQWGALGADFIPCILSGADSQLLQHNSVTAKAPGCFPVPGH